MPCHWSALDSQSNPKHFNKPNTHNPFSVLLNKPHLHLSTVMAQLHNGDGFRGHRRPKKGACGFQFIILSTIATMWWGESQLCYTKTRSMIATFTPYSGCQWPNRGGCFSIFQSVLFFLWIFEVLTSGSSWNFNGLSLLQILSMFFYFIFYFLFL